MSRTPEQKAADDALRDAIWQGIGAMHVDDEGTTGHRSGILTKFMVIAIQVDYDPEGNPTDATSLLFSDGSVLGYEAEGMLAQANRIFAQDRQARSGTWDDTDT